MKNTIETKTTKNGNVTVKVNGERVNIKVAALVAKKTMLPTSTDTTEIINEAGEKFTYGGSEFKQGYTYYYFNNENGKSFDVNNIKGGYEVIAEYAIKTIAKMPEIEAMNAEYKASEIRWAEIATIEDYAVSPEAQDATVEAEIEIANSEVKAEVKISISNDDDDDDDETPEEIMLNWAVDKNANLVAERCTALEAGRDWDWILANESIYSSDDDFAAIGKHVENINRAICKPTTVKANEVDAEIEQATNTAAETEIDEDEAAENKTAIVIPYELFIAMHAKKTAEEIAAEERELAEAERRHKIEDLEFNIQFYEEKRERTAGNLQDIRDNHISKHPDDESLKEFAAELETEIAGFEAKIADLKAELAEVNPPEPEGYDETAFDLLPTIGELNDVDDEVKTETAAAPVNSETQTAIEPEITKAEKIAELEHKIECIASRRQDALDELEDAEANEDIAPFVVWQRENQVAALTEEYEKCVRELEELQKPDEPAHAAERIQIDDVRELWLSQEWQIDLWIRAEDEDGNDVEITQADFDAVEKSLRGKYYIDWEQGGIEFFAEDANASLLSAICTELEERGCIIDDAYGEWVENRKEEGLSVPDEDETPADDNGNDAPRFTVCIEPAPLEDKNGVITDLVNQHAPDGWKVIPDKEKLRVEYKGKHVADADHYTTCDFLLPENFFNQFLPLVDKTKTPEQMKLDNLYRELANLEEMRESPDNTPESAKTLDEMIKRIKRDIAAAEFGTTDTVASCCKAGAIDEHGKLWF